MVDLTEQQKLILAYQAVFSSAEGKKVLDDLNQFCGLFEAIYQSEATHDTAFFLGARSVALHIRERLSVEIGKDANHATAES